MTCHETHTKKEPKKCLCLQLCIHAYVLSVSVISHTPVCSTSGSVIDAIVPHYTHC